MSKLTRWYYNLTEKQVIKIVFTVGAIGIIFDVIIFFTNYISGKLPKGEYLLLYLCSLFLFPLLLAFLIHMLLWMSPSKQLYIIEKAHNDTFIPEVRKRFGLGPEFKEVIYVPNQTDHYNFINYIKILNNLEVKYFVSEFEDVILLSIRSKEGKELELLKIENYNFFDLNFKPKK